MFVNNRASLEECHDFFPWCIANHRNSSSACLQWKGSVAFAWDCAPIVERRAHGGQNHATGITLMTKDNSLTYLSISRRVVVINKGEHPGAWQQQYNFHISPHLWSCISFNLAPRPRLRSVILYHLVCPRFTRGVSFGKNGPRTPAAEYAPQHRGQTPLTRTNRQPKPYCPASTRTAAMRSLRTRRSFPIPTPGGASSAVCRLWRPLASLARNFESHSMARRILI